MDNLMTATLRKAMAHANRMATAATTAEVAHLEAILRRDGKRERIAERIAPQARQAAHDAAVSLAVVRKSLGL